MRKSEPLPHRHRGEASCPPPNAARQGAARAPLPSRAGSRAPRDRHEPKARATAPTTRAACPGRAGKGTKAGGSCGAGVHPREQCQYMRRAEPANHVTAMGERRVATNCVVVGLDLGEPEI